MKLLLFAFFSISNGNYDSDGLHDVGIPVVEHRRSIVFLKPWVLELINSRARDDRTDQKISTASDRSTIIVLMKVVQNGFLISIRPVV